MVSALPRDCRGKGSIIDLSRRPDARRKQKDEWRSRRAGTVKNCSSRPAVLLLARGRHGSATSASIAGPGGTVPPGGNDAS